MLSHAEASALTNLVILVVTDETSVQEAAAMASEYALLDKVIVATGILHEDEVAPEKSLRDLSAEKFKWVFAINTIGPTLVMKHFLPVLQREERAFFAALSARVGSVSDKVPFTRVKAIGYFYSRL